MKLTIIALIAAILLFCTYPQIDLIVSGLFYKEGFYLAYHPIVYGVYMSVRVFCVLTAGVASFIILYDFLKKKNIKLPLQSIADKVRGYIRFDNRAAALLLLVIIITPGVMVHNVMKPFWDRARPRHIEQFGGELKFTPIYEIKRAHDGNNSFPSGHASMAASLIALGFLVAQSRRRLVFTVTSIYAVIASLGRVVQGGHYLSDVTISFLITMLTIFIVRRWLYRV
ncbi:MAG TPA: hypothetical protein DIV86_00360 [Alphaproteobacteria bacterium]|nr:hypothetical protein [Alphaproteobacteria bacterium]